MIAKKGSRRVSVDGVLYRWGYPRRPTRAQRDGAAIHIPVCAESGGSTLLVEMNSPHSSNCVQRFGYAVTPASVAAWIRQAREQGWIPGEPGPQHRLQRRQSLQRALPPGQQHPVSEDQAADLDQGPFHALSVIRDGNCWRPAIDGADFLQLVREAESAHVRREVRQRNLDPGAFLPGDYGPWFLLRRGSYLGQPQPPGFIFADGDPRIDKTELIDCSCGCSGCWPLMASIYSFETHVVWANFEQVHRDWILDLGAFVFRRDAYEEIFERLR